MAGVSVRFQVSKEIERPVSDVWHFYAVEHVRNHPRWDPHMELEQITPGPIGLGTRIRRRSTHGPTPADGEMEVVEFEPERAFGLSIHDPDMEMEGRVTFEPRGPERTLLTGVVDIPGMEESADMDALTSSIEQSLNRVKAMIETET